LFQIQLKNLNSTINLIITKSKSPLQHRFEYKFCK